MLWLLLTTTSGSKNAATAWTPDLSGQADTTQIGFDAPDYLIFVGN